MVCLQGRNGFIVLAGDTGVTSKRLAADETVNCDTEEKTTVLEGNYNREPGADCQQRTAVHLTFRPFEAVSIAEVFLEDLAWLGGSRRHPRRTGQCVWRCGRRRRGERRRHRSHGRTAGGAPAPKGCGLAEDREGVWRPRLGSRKAHPAEAARCRRPRTPRVGPRRRRKSATARCHAII